MFKSTLKGRELVDSHYRHQGLIAHNVKLYDLPINLDNVYHEDLLSFQEFFEDSVNDILNDYSDRCGHKIAFIGRSASHIVMFDTESFGSDGSHVNREAWAVGLFDDCVTEIFALFKSHLSDAQLARRVEFSHKLCVVKVNNCFGVANTYNNPVNTIVPNCNPGLVF